MSEEERERMGKKSVREKEFGEKRGREREGGSWREREGAIGKRVGENVCGCGFVCV